MDDNCLQKGDIIVLITKVRNHDKVKLKAIAKHFGMSFYQMFQYLLLFILRYFDRHSDISTEHEALIESFLNLLRVQKGSFTPLQIASREICSIKKAVFFIDRKQGEHPQLLSASINEDGAMTESYNTNEILADIIASIDTKLLDDLNEKKQAVGHISIIDTLRSLLQTTQDERIHGEISKMFTEEINEIFEDPSIETSGELADTNYKQVATKVKRKDRLKIEAIAKLFGTNLYFLYQSLLVLLLRYFDRHSDISTEHEALIESFLNLLRVQKGSFTPLQIASREICSIKKAVFFIDRKQGEHPQLLSASINEDGAMTESYNTNEILADIIASIDTKLLDDLNEKKQAVGHISIIDTLRSLLQTTQDERIHGEISKMFTEEINEIFEDLSIETFEELADTFYKRKHIKTIDGVCSHIPEAAKSKHDCRTWY